LEKKPIATGADLTMVTIPQKEWIQSLNILIGENFSK